MRRLFLLWCLSLGFLLPLCAASPISTTDHLTISELTLDPGGASGTLTISLSGSERYYTAYNLDLHLPSGISVCYNAKGEPDVALVKGSSGLYPYTDEEEDGDLIRTYSHTLSSSYNVVGDNILRVACFSISNEPFTAVSGDLFRVRVTASGYTRPGDYTPTIDGVALITAEGAQQYVPSAVMQSVIHVSTAATIGVTVTAANRFGTLILPFSASLPEGLEAYGCDRASDTTLWLTSASRLEAFTPYILYAEAGFSGSLSGTVEPAHYVNRATAGYLTGVLTATDISSGFIMQNKGGGPRFYMIAPYTYALAAGKCYVVLPADLAEKPSFRMASNTTGIETMPTTESDSREMPLYNLQGQPVTSPITPGLYIRKGKKMYYGK